MKLTVEGAVAAEVFPVGRPGGHVTWFTVVKQSWRLERGMLAPHERPVPYLADDAELDGAVHTSDLGLFKDGCDVVVLGEAWSARPAERTEVRVVAGGLDHKLVITGDRVWERGFLGRVRASAPRPFERMPLTWARAYGGKAIADEEGTEIAWPANPEGRGFVMRGQKARADGAPLPNVEWPDALVTSWEDQPEAAGTAFYPRTWGLRLLKAVTPGPRGGPPTIERAAFNQAHPRLVVPSLPQGSLHVAGLGPQPFEGPVPRPEARVHVMRTTGPVELPVTWDLLVIEPSQGRVTIGGRASFAYLPEVDWASHVRVTAGATP